MKSCKLLVLLFIFVHSGNSCEVAEDQVTFFLYSRDRDVEVQLTNETLSLVNSSKPTRFLIHGWIAARNTTWFIDATDAYLIKGDYNVIQVDWSEPASQDDALGCVESVGYFVGNLISRLIKHHSVSPSNIHIAGHSLGAHVSGFAGKIVKKQTLSKLRQIIALDPANVFLNDTTGEGRLYKEDAEVVAALHTDGGKSGYLEAIGTIDFFPDGGSAVQPGCETSEIDWCSHTIVTDYFIESINNTNGFVSTQCASYEEYETGSCANNKKVTFGGNLTAEDEGKYYLHTNKEKPYSKE